ncbi:MAG TPA: hypothetical protein VG753_01560 [Candidatus Paceibacterota bacterium]|nr:hypothetical protein [Candidatus Paceibacterota bacterium]
MRGQTSWTVIGIIIIIIIAIFGAWWLFWGPGAAPATTSTANNAADEAAVQQTVTSFGSQLQMVSLMASTSIAADAIGQYYGAYVDPTLLQSWEANPSSAPGRETSSPWPDHIDITSVVNNPDGSYTVQGSVAEVANGAQGTTTVDSYPVSLTLTNNGGVWLITNYDRLDK